MRPASAYSLECPCGEARETVEEAGVCGCGRRWEARFREPMTVEDGDTPEDADA